uniref:Salivary lipocalin n=1 Tax=Caenorhabditis tropicalis TaxID=1561998 RepID=A0A1I7TT09_9PELO
MKFLLLVLTVSAVESIETTPPSGEWTPLYAQSLAPSDDNTLQHIETTPPSGEWTPLHTVPSGDYTPQYIASTPQSFNYAADYTPENIETTPESLVYTAHSSYQSEEDIFDKPKEECRTFKSRFGKKTLLTHWCSQKATLRSTVNGVCTISTYYRENLTFNIKTLLAPYNNIPACTKTPCDSVEKIKVDCEEAFGEKLKLIENN